MNGLEVRYRLGAEELIELGNSRVASPRPAGPRRTFFGGRPGIVRKPALGKSGPPEIDWVASGGVFLSRYLDAALAVLFDLAGMEPGGPTSGGWARKMSALLGDIPALGALVEGLQVAARAVRRFQLPLSRRSEALLREMLPAAEESLDRTVDPSRRARLESEAKERLADSAPEHLRSAVIELLESSGLPGDGSGSLGGFQIRPDATFPPLPVEDPAAAPRASR